VCEHTRSHSGRWRSDELCGHSQRRKGSGKAVRVHDLPVPHWAKFVDYIDGSEDRGLRARIGTGEESAYFAKPIMSDSCRSATPECARGLTSHNRVRACEEDGRARKVDKALLVLEQFAIGVPRRVVATAEQIGSLFQPSSATPSKG
jgi:hypothetical protein